MSKTQAIALGPSLYAYDFYFNNNRIEPKDTLRVSDVTLDHNLSFKPHVNEIIVINRARFFLPKSCLKTLFFKFVVIVVNEILLLCS